MKILFFGEDESMRHMAESLTNVEAVHSTDFKKTQAILKEWNKERGDDLDVFISVLDLGLGLKELDKFAKKTKKIAGHFRCVFAYTKDLAELKSYQKTKWACDGQLLGPLNLEGLQEIVSDFETVYYLDELDLEDDEELELTELESNAQRELENLNEDKEDYDTTESAMVLPDEFQKAGGTSDDKTVSKEMSTSEISGSPEAEEPAAEAAIFHNNPTHKKIQEVFDHVFKYGKKSNPSQSSEDLELPEDETDEQISSQSEAKMAEPKAESKDLEIGLEFDLPDDEESLDQGEEDQAAQENKSASTEKNDDEDDGLNFELSFDDEDEEETPAPKEAVKADSTKDDDKNDEDEGDDELSFSTDEDDDGTSFEESTAELLADDHSLEQDDPETSEDSLDFDDGSDETDEGTLSLSSEKHDPNASVAETSSGEDSPGDLDFGEDEDDGLSFELGGASETQEQSEDAQQETHSPGDIDFDEDEDADEFQMSDGESENEVAGTEDAGPDEFGDLDLSSSESTEDEELDATKVAPSPGEDDNTKDKVDQTISEIVKEDLSSEASSSADEEATGEFDLPDGLPSELTDDMLSEESTDSQGFSVDEWEEDEASAAPVAENTNPTVVTSDHNFEKDEGGFALSDDDDEDEELEEIVAQKENDKTEESNESSSDVSTPAPKGLSAYAEDELTRLQSTIRQLREERDENHKQIQELKKESRLIEQEGLSEKAELDELKIEISILKKRHKNEIEELRYQLKLAEEKKQIYEERCRNYQKEFERLNQKVRIEFNQVKQREKELESQLELVTMDTEAQVQSRDGKILELKRKIDSLEFNMENASIREQKSREDKARLEERLTKIMSTLRGSIQLLEDNDDSVDPNVDGDSDEKNR